MAEDIKDKAANAGPAGDAAVNEAGTESKADNAAHAGAADQGNRDSQAAHAGNAGDGTCDSDHDRAGDGKAASETDTNHEAAHDESGEAPSEDGSGNETDNASGDPEPDAGAGHEAPKDGADAKKTKPDSKDLKIAELNDRYLRLFAEFDNFRKRSEAEKSTMFSEGEKTVLLKVLPLIDNFERALDTLSEEDKQTPFADGMEKVYRAFMDQLKQFGVTHIEAVGKEFDANLHNAVMHVDDDSQGENIVVEEFQKGYMFRDKVLRYSMVKVAN